MLWAVWGSLAFLLVATVVGSVHIVREALSFWRTLKAFTALLGRAGDVLAARVDDASRKAAGSGDAVERLAVAVDRLSRSLAYARVVGDATSGAVASYIALRALLPRK